MGGDGGLLNALAMSWWAVAIASASYPIFPALISAATSCTAASAGSFTKSRFSVMSGLLGLFVWKQKATTDAPDTLFNCNTKSQAKKNHRAMVVSSTAQNVKLCEANHADI